jgi:cation diffusion facilitator CzcD-associated flavoprotein CzcO
MPKSYPDFPHHTQIAKYFEAYVDHFGFRSKIRFSTPVEQALPDGDGWRVRAAGEDHRYDYLLVANGHHWDPLMPEPAFPGDFDGRQLHAHHYKSKDEFRGKRVVVVGMGNSAMDLAVEASEVGAATFLSARRGVYVIPKYMLGKPLDQFFTSARIPWKLRRLMAEKLHQHVVGDMERYGLPKPDHRIGSAHPTVSGRILDRLTHGAVTVKPNIERLESDSVRFIDGSVEKADVIVYCTGYKVTFPFFDRDFIEAKDNDLPLFMRVFHPTQPRLAFVGLLQPLGAIMPLAEAQGRWIAQWIKGEYRLPPLAEMRRRMDEERRIMFARYVKSKRHTMQVDFDDYMLELEREIQRGKRRKN